MRIAHRCVTSPVFELVKTVELDIQLGDEYGWTTRIELFREVGRDTRYRCHVWELELFRLTPSFPRNEDGEPAHVTDDTLLVERGIAHGGVASGLNRSFDAPDVEAALEMVAEDLKKFLEHVSGGKAE